MNRPRMKDKHLPRGVYLRHGAYFHVRKGRWENIGKDLRTALARYAANMEEPVGGMPDLIDAALSHISHSLAKNTQKAYKSASRRLKIAFAEFAPDQVKPKHVAALKASMISRQSFANTCLTTLRLIFAYAVEAQLLDMNPVIGIRPYRTKKRDRLLSIEEYIAIYARSSPRTQVIMDLCIRTGQRIGDVLKIQRIDLLPEGIRFKQQKTHAKGIVKWTPELRAIVERAKTLNGNIRSISLLHDRTGKVPTYWTTREAWKLACTKAGVKDARLHDLRAFAATVAKQQGMDATALLFHASPAQTTRYLRDKSEPMMDGPSFGLLIDGAKK